jgi:hypothetical protein
VKFWHENFPRGFVILICSKNTNANLTLPNWASEFYFKSKQGKLVACGSVLVILATEEAEIWRISV